MARIHDCPAELLQGIVTAACAYDLRTTCALRLVNRRISTVCAPLRFNEVAVSGEGRINALLHALNGADPSDVHIYRLFISDRIQEEADEYFDVVNNGWASEAEDKKHNEGVICRNREEASRLEKVIAGIIRHASAQVESLCLLSFNPELTHVHHCVKDLAYPHLTDLTIRFTPLANIHDNWGHTSLPMVHTLTLRLPRSLTGTLHRLLTLLAPEDELEELTLIEYWPSLTDNVVLRGLLSDDSGFQCKRLRRLEISTVVNWRDAASHNLWLNEWVEFSLETIRSQWGEIVAVREDDDRYDST